MTSPMMVSLNGRRMPAYGIEIGETVSAANGDVTLAAVREANRRDMDKIASQYPNLARDAMRDKSLYQRTLAAWHGRTETRATRPRTGAQRPQTRRGRSTGHLPGPSTTPPGWRL